MSAAMLTVVLTRFQRGDFFGEMDYSTTRRARHRQRRN
jgi:hypothetical protein